MEYIHFDYFDFKDEGINVMVRRGTHYDKLQHEEFFRMYNRDSRTEYGLARVLECVVIKFDDIVVPQMTIHKSKDHFLKDLLQEHHNFHTNEIVTLVYFVIHHKYKERDNGETDSSD